MRAILLAIGFFCCAGHLVLAQQLSVRTLSRVSLTSEGLQREGASLDPVLSAKGRYVVYLGIGADHKVLGLFLYDRQLSKTVSIGPGSNASVSADGQRVAFSRAVSGHRQVLVYHIAEGSTQMISVDAAGLPGNNDSDVPSISGDGRFVAYSSAASNLATAQRQAGLLHYNLLLHDRSEGTTGLISSKSGNQLPVISSDGRWVAFEALARMPGSDSLINAIFLHDRNTGASNPVTSLGEIPTLRPVDDPDNIHHLPHYLSISGDGRLLAYSSSDPSLVSGDSNRKSDVFICDLRTRVVKRISVGLAGEEANGDSFAPKISDNGRFVVFTSEASNLAAGDTNGKSDVFVYDVARVNAILS